MLKRKLHNINSRIEFVVYENTNTLVIYKELHTHSSICFRRDNTKWDEALIRDIKFFIDSNSSDTILIQVHSDTRGSDSANLDYTLKKAEKIHQKLTSMYPAITFISKGLGETLPLIDYAFIRRQNNEEQKKLHHLNSRIEFINSTPKNE